ncbi:hypothetical protein ACX0HA_06080 [Flavobacterium hauense]
MKLRNTIPFTIVLFIIFTITGCSRKVYPNAEYHQLTGRNAKPYTKIGEKTAENTLELSKKYKFRLSAEDSVMVYQLHQTKIISNYKEFFADVVPGKNYKVTIHSLPDKHMSTNKYLFMPLAFAFDKSNNRTKLTAVENEFANGFEEIGFKRAFTFNNIDTDQVKIVIFSDNKELDKKIHTFILNFVSFKYMTTTTGDFYITLEEINENEAVSRFSNARSDERGTKG